jgi:hypothetical protein
MAATGTVSFTPEQWATILARLDALHAHIRDLERSVGILEADAEDRDDIANAEDLEAEFAEVTG